MPQDAPPHPQIVFSGGGTRCFRHGGLMSVARGRSAPGPSQIARVSGGERTARLTGALATVAHGAELHIPSRPDLEWAETAGLSTSRVVAREAAREKRPMVDAGMAGRAPAVEPDRGARWC